MGNYRTTVILKTDIVDSTPRLSEQTQAEMGLQRRQHRQFIAEIAVKHRGSVFEEEGDAYWMEFPSVTDAVFAAIEMHQNLRSTQAGKMANQRLTIRAVITLGDILHQENDTIGMTMSLTTRIEKITPANEIYLSQAAWLVLNKAEVQTSLVNEFQFKGFSEPEKVYRIDQKRGIRVLTDQCIVLADANGFTNFIKSNNTEIIESFLLEYDDLMSVVCEKHAGVIRQIDGDQYFMTFAEANQTVDAVTMIRQSWKGISERFNIGMSIGAHKGKLYVFRSYVFGEDINITAYLSDLGSLYKPEIDHVSVAVSGKIREEVTGAEYAEMFQELDVTKLRQDKGKAILQAQGAYALMTERSRWSAL
jgi:class 3 adenylate cyclase